MLVCACGCLCVLVWACVCLCVLVRARVCLCMSVWVRVGAEGVWVGGSAGRRAITGGRNKSLWGLRERNERLGVRCVLCLGAGLLSAGAKHTVPRLLLLLKIARLTPTLYDE